MTSPSLETDQENGSDQTLAKLETLRRYHEKIQSLERIRNEANLEVEPKKLDLKEAKEHAKSCEQNLQRAIRGDDAQKELPFEDDEPRQQEDESWREVSIEDAGIPEKLCTFLRENRPPLETVGDIADWSDKHKKLLTDVKGIGAAKATQIDEILVEFFDSRNNDTPEDEAGEDEDE